MLALRRVPCRRACRVVVVVLLARSVPSQLERAHHAQVSVWMTGHTGLRHISSGRATPPRLTSVRVQVGIAGQLAEFRSRHLADMNYLMFLKALRNDAGFAVKLRPIPLDECTVTVLTTSGVEPSAHEEQAAVDFTGETRLGALTAQWPAGSSVLICVRLPGDPAAGKLRYDPSLCIPYSAWRVLPESVQHAAMATAALRTSLATLPALTSLRTVHQRGLSTSHGLTVHGDPAPKLGVLSVPPVPRSVTRSPKGDAAASVTFVVRLKFACAGFSLEAGVHLVLEQTRVSIAAEFVDEMKRPSANARGVLLSGPNGVGKSACGVLAVLACFADRLLVVYIPNALAWVDAADVGDGDAFLLNQLLHQNADLIAADKQLFDVFKPVFSGRERLGAATMSRLCTLLDRLSETNIGVVVDEVQTITNAVEHDQSRRTGASRYFSTRWYRWNSHPAAAFVRMDIASSHGLREFKISSGDEWRLRFIPPWPDATMQAFTSSPTSPGYIHDVDCRAAVAFVGGGVVRTAMLGQQLLEKHGHTDSGRRTVVETLRAAMKDECDRWLTELERKGPADVKRAVHAAMPLIRGQVRWQSFSKPLYDSGLIALDPDTMFVRPVSIVASSVILQVLSGAARPHFVPLRNIPQDAERGYEMERQLRSVMDNCSGRDVPTHVLQGDAANAVRFQTGSSLPFTTAADTTSQSSGAVLYVPRNDQYPADAIIVPPVDDDTSSPIIVLESSVTMPRDSKRISKVCKWFASGGLIDQLRTKHGSRDIICMLCWNGKYDASPTAIAYKQLDALAAQARVQVRVLDEAALHDLGMLL